MQVSAPRACENFWYFIQENYLVILLNNALVDLSPRIQNETLKKACIRVRIRGAFLVKKEAPKLVFRRGRGQLHQFVPLNPPLVLSRKVMDCRCGLNYDQTSFLSDCVVSLQ